MEIIRKELIGTITLQNEVDITDPCYDKDVWCRMTTECKPGTYTGYAYFSDEGAWGERVSRLGIFKDDKEIDINSMEIIGDIGVDTATAGFFNNKPDFNYDEWNLFIKETGMYTNDSLCWRSKYGLISSSGCGDGDYYVYASKDRDAFMIVFID